ncbi:MAG TPA: sulfur carrier protein ThiS [Miltoncostaeaceae bacterium]|nr:sulfur carrier protein ThiS [Miltoncostaeaceae bacterium]
MRATVNGAERSLPPGACVVDVLRACGIGEDERALAVAVDGEVVPRTAWGGTRVPDGARVEVVRPAAGG